MRSSEGGAGECRRPSVSCSNSPAGPHTLLSNISTSILRVYERKSEVVNYNIFHYIHLVLWFNIILTAWCVCVCSLESSKNKVYYNWQIFVIHQKSFHTDVSQYTTLRRCLQHQSETKYAPPLGNLFKNLTRDPRHYAGKVSRRCKNSASCKCKLAKFRQRAGKVVQKPWPGVCDEADPAAVARPNSCPLCGHNNLCAKHYGHDNVLLYCGHNLCGSLWP